MPQKTGIKNGRNWVPPLVFLLLILSLLFGIHNSQTHEISFTDSVLKWARNFTYFADAIIRSVGPLLLIAALFLHQRRARTLAWFALALCAVRITVEILNYFILDDAHSKSGTTFYTLVVGSSLATDGLAIIMLLLLPRFTKAARAIQITAIITTALAFAIQILVVSRFLSFNVPLQIARFVIVAVCLLSIPAVAYLGLFRQRSSPTP